MLFREELPASLLEQVKKYPENEKIIQEELREYELIVDSEEQARERPKNYQTQKEYYSGKQRNHTFKNQFITLPLGSDIVDVVAGRPGPVSDINLCRERLYKFHPEQRLIGDKAYVGEAQIRTPHKKPKKREITPEQKQENKALSSERIFVEHLIRVVKIFKTAQERFRLRKDRYASVILTICGLVRLRKGCLILLGKVRLVISFENPELTGTYAVLLSNRTDWSAQKILASYLKRWPIETFYQDSKGHLGLDQYRMRTARSHSKTLVSGLRSLFTSTPSLFTAVIDIR